MRAWQIVFHLNFRLRMPNHPLYGPGPVGCGWKKGRTAERPLGSVTRRAFGRASRLLVTTLTVLFVTFSFGLFPAGPRSAAAGRCPNLTILIDRSGSMKSDLAGHDPPDTGQMSRWAIAQSGLAAVLGQYDGHLPIGFSYFPTDNSCGSKSSLPVPPDYYTKVNILNTLYAIAPGGNTPTSYAIGKLRMLAPLTDSSRQQYLLLVTDGAPNCVPNDPNEEIALSSTLSEIREAQKQSPSIKTFVVGFGSGLPTTFQDNLDQMANAGGVPNSDPNFPHKYYPADSPAALLNSLQRILGTVTTGGDVGSGVTICDDSCYAQGCPGAGQICHNGVCQENPCAGRSCPDGQYCYTDGTTSECRPTCTEVCMDGQRCVRGKCQPDPCFGVCTSGSTCNATAGQCMPDPACSGVVCHSAQGCIGGRCVDDPCLFITCPAGLSCVPNEGTCQPPGFISNPMVGGPSGAGSVGSGCHCDISDRHSDSATLLTPLLFLLLAFTLGRKRLPLA